MLKKGLSLLLTAIMVLSTLMAPVYAQQSYFGAAEKISSEYEQPSQSGSISGTIDERFEETDRNSRTSDLYFDEPDLENPYGAVKVNEERANEIQRAITPQEQEKAIKSMAFVSTDDFGEIAYDHLEYITENIGARVADNIAGEDVPMSDSELQTTTYLYHNLMSMGYDVEIQPFTFTSRGKEYESSNIIATKNGESDEVVIVGAHYDSVAPKVWLNPPEEGEETVTEAVYMYGNGADDNASGVAIMLEAAERLVDIETPYTVKFVAFGAEEKGKIGSGYYVTQMTEEDIENTVAMINLDSCIAGNNMYVHGDEGEDGWVRELALDIAERLDLDLVIQEGLNPEYPAGTTGDWSDHAPFAELGIPYAYFEATDWTLGEFDGYVQVDPEYGVDGEIWHTGYDNIEYIEENFPGRIEDRLSTYSEVLTNMLVQIEEPGQGVRGMSLSDYLVSMTQEEEIEVTADLGYMPDREDLEWTLGGKDFSEWKKYNPDDRKFTGEPYVTLVDEPTIEGSIIRATVKFDLPFNTVNLSGQRSRYPALLGSYELCVTDTAKDSTAGTILKYNAYDSYHTYDQLKPAIDAIMENAMSDRYIEYKSLGETVEGRDAHFAIIARDKASVDEYLNETMPMMLEDPQALQDKITAGAMGDYKIPVWFNNIHPDEAPGVDAILELFNQFATKDTVSYKTTGSVKGPVDEYGFGTNLEEPAEEATVELDVENALDNLIFLFNFTENPDGRYYNTRANVNGFDINRDNAYQTQVEAIMTTSEIAKWKPVSFLDFHGFVGGFLLEPCTTPHDPNFEYDLLIENMLEQAHLMGKAGVANTKYERYEIPFEDHPGAWDDGVPSYTAVFAMAMGALGHTIEIPELNEDSVDALIATGLASVNYVAENKDELFNNQLEYYERGIEGIDAKEEVDPWLLDAAGNEIGRPRGENENFFPEYYVIPVDKSVQKNALEAYKLAQYMLRNGVKVCTSTEAVTAGEVTYPEGSFVIDMHQPLRGYANDILYGGYDVSDFAEMYAEIVNAFPDTRGFDSYEVRIADAFAGKLENVSEVVIPATTIPAEAARYIIKNSNNDAVRAVNELLDRSKTVEMLTQSGTDYERGDYVVSKADLSLVKDDYLLDVAPYNGTTASIALLKPMVAVPSATGHLKFVLEELGFDLVSSAANGDVIVTDANTNVKANIDSGMPYIGIGGSAMRFVKDTLKLEGFGYMSSGYEALMRGTIAQDSLITAGYPENAVIYNAKGGYISSVPAGAKVLTRLNDDDTYFKAGWWPDTDLYNGIDYGKLQSKGKALAITTKVGTSDVTVFANNLVNKGHPQADWRMLANAIFTAVTDNEAQQPGPYAISFENAPASFKLGNDANITVKISVDEVMEQKVTLVVAIYDSATNSMVNYSYIARTVKMGEEEVLNAGFRIPSVGNYAVKAFVLDSFDNGKVLSDIIIIPVVE